MTFRIAATVLGTRVAGAFAAAGYRRTRKTGGLLQELLRAKTLRVRYAPAHTDAAETIRFTLDGLSSALARLTSCTWS